MQAYKIADRLRTAADSFHMMHFAYVCLYETNENMHVCSLRCFFFRFEAVESDRRMQCQQLQYSTLCYVCRLMMSNLFLRT